MTPQAREAADAIYAEGASWSADRTTLLQSSRKVAWIVAIVAVVIALFEAVALMLLMPLKTVVPYTLLVDRQTGYVQALDPLQPKHIAPDAALTQSFLVQYVIGRESFDIATLQNDYRKIYLWSADSARSDYVVSAQISNPDSALARLPRTAIIETRVRSVSPLGGNTALVRFETVRRDRAGGTGDIQSWVAIIGYRFSTAPMSAEDRFLNPLGFQVVRYRRTAETLPTATEPVPAAAPAQPQVLVVPTVMPTTPSVPTAVPNGSPLGPARPVTAVPGARR